MEKGCKKLGWGGQSRQSSNSSVVGVALTSSGSTLKGNHLKKYYYMSQSGGKLYIGRTQHTDNQIRFEIILSDTKSPFCDLVWQPVPGLTNLPFSELERRESWNHLRCWTKRDETWLEQLCPRESERLNGRNVWKPLWLKGSRGIALAPAHIHAQPWKEVSSFLGMPLTPTGPH